MSREIFKKSLGVETNFFGDWGYEETGIYLYNKEMGISTRDENCGLPRGFVWESKKREVCLTDEKKGV